MRKFKIICNAITYDHETIYLSAHYDGNVHNLRYRLKVIVAALNAHMKLKRKKFTFSYEIENESPENS